MKFLSQTMEVMRISLLFLTACIFFSGCNTDEDQEEHGNSPAGAAEEEPALASGGRLSCAEADAKLQETLDIYKTAKAEGNRIRAAKRAANAETFRALDAYKAALAEESRALDAYDPASASAETFRTWKAASAEAFRASDAYKAALAKESRIWDAYSGEGMKVKVLIALDAYEEAKAEICKKL